MKRWSTSALLPLIATVRHRRLPVLGAEPWPTLEAHGIPESLKHDFCRKFDFAIELLISMHGRPPVQKRRVRAMSIGRYLTPFEKKSFGPSPGIEGGGKAQLSGSNARRLDRHARPRPNAGSCSRRGDRDQRRSSVAARGSVAIEKRSRRGRCRRSAAMKNNSPFVRCRTEAPATII